MKNAKLRKNAKYCAMQAIYWMLACICIAYAGVFLPARGYSNAEYGVIMAVGYVLGMLLQPLVSSFTDRTTKLTATQMLVIVTLAVALPVTGLIVFKTRGFALTASYVCFLAFQLVLQPLVNAYCFYLQTPETPIRFGIARGIGSLGWAGLSAVVGGMVKRLGDHILPYAALVVLALMLGLLYLCHLEGPSLLQQTKVQPDAAGKSELTVRSLFGKYHGFLFLLIGNMLIFFGHSQVDNFPYQILANVGGDSGTLGLFIAYTALLEIPGMFLSDKICAKLTYQRVLRLSAALFVVKAALLFALRSLAGVFISNAFQFASFALFVPAAVMYAGNVAGARDANKAQSLVTATTTAGNILTSAVGGLLIDGIGVYGMLGVGVAVTLIGAIFVIFGIGKKAPRSV